ncbi:glycosyltransferase, partial [Roseiflexus sp.]
MTSPVSGAFIRDQARLLAERFAVNVLAVQSIGLRAAFRDRRRSSIEHDGKVVVYRVYAPTPPYIPHLHFLSSAYVAWRELHKYIRRHGCPDLIHAHVVLPCGWVAAQASRAWNIPALLTEHSGP